MSSKTSMSSMRRLLLSSSALSVRGIWQVAAQHDVEFRHTRQQFLHGTRSQKAPVALDLRREASPQRATRIFWIRYAIRARNAADGECGSPSAPRAANRRNLQRSAGLAFRVGDNARQAAARKKNAERPHSKRLPDGRTQRLHPCPCGLGKVPERKRGRPLGCCGL
jgi:hypothetical protein